MNNSKDILFKNVQCKGYYKTFKDGKRVKLSDDESSCKYMVFDEEYAELECQCTGEKEFLKEYYIHKDEMFTGVVVSTKKKIMVSGYLVVDRNSDNSLSVHLHPEKTERCAIVYFADGRKHLVPFDDILNVAA